jgi:hypothetical protein
MVRDSADRTAVLAHRLPLHGGFLRIEIRAKLRARVPPFACLVGDNAIRVSVNVEDFAEGGCDFV